MSGSETYLLGADNLSFYSQPCLQDDSGLGGGSQSGLAFPGLGGDGSGQFVPNPVTGSRLAIPVPNPAAGFNFGATGGRKRPVANGARGGRAPISGLVHNHSGTRVDEDRLRQLEEDVQEVKFQVLQMQAGMERLPEIVISGLHDGLRSGQEGWIGQASQLMASQTSQEIRALGEDWRDKLKAMESLLQSHTQGHHDAQQALVQKLLARIEDGQQDHGHQLCRVTEQLRAMESMICHFQQVTQQAWATMSSSGGGRASPRAGPSRPLSPIGRPLMTSSPGKDPEQTRWVHPGGMEADMTVRSHRRLL